MIDQRAALHAVGALAPELEAPGFELGRWQGGEAAPDPPGVMTMPWYELSDRGEAIIDALRALVVVFDWPAWAQTPEARALRDDRDALAAASADQLARLATWLVRAERFSDGGFEAAFESGLLAAMARRAAQLATAEGDARYDPT